MDVAVLEERARLLHQSVNNADSARRSFSFTAQHIVALLLFALAPSIPHAHHLFGKLTTQVTFILISSAIASTLVAVWIFHRSGSESAAYRRAGVLEFGCNYFVNVSTVFASGTTWSVLWILSPFTAIFMATTKPFERRMFFAITGSLHAAFALLAIALKHPERAIAALVVGAFSFVAYSVVSRQARRAINVQAERNVARARLYDARLDQARRQVAQTLRDGIGRDIAALARELGVDAAGHASAALSELDGIVATVRVDTGALTLTNLLKRIDERCKPLCVGLDYQSEAVGEGDGALIAPEPALALLRVSQECVRNAVVHAMARRIRLVLACSEDSEHVLVTVSDDGTGFSDEQFANATGGLSNARDWMREVGGSLKQLSRSTEGSGASVQATVHREGAKPASTFPHSHTLRNA